MKIGAVFPQTEIGTDLLAVRDYVQAAESLGYDHLIAYDHVLGANAGSRPGWGGVHFHTDMFYDPFVLFGYVAGVTERIELVTSVIVLPQRQTVLVAKQAATLDVLSRSRLRLGISTGWNEVEYEALGENFHDRGIRSEEQIEVMKSLWTQDLVTYEGRWHKITDAGLNPLPIQRPIPIWFGGHVEAVLRRVARFGDGWFPEERHFNLGNHDDATRAMIEKMYDYIRQEGREPSDIGIESWVNIDGRSEEEWFNDVVAWKGLGATHISVNTLGAGLSTPEDHIDAIRRFKEVVGGMAD